MRRLILFLAIGLAGCAGAEGPSAESIQAALTFPANYKTELLAHLRTFLNDPSNVRSAYVSLPTLERLGGVERYINCVRFDAKSTTGGYRGSRDHLASYFNGKLEQFVELRAEASDRCKSADYQPFPELEKLSRR